MNKITVGENVAKNGYVKMGQWFQDNKGGVWLLAGADISSAVLVSPYDGRQYCRPVEVTNVNMIGSHEWCAICDDDPESFTPLPDGMKITIEAGMSRA